MKCSPFDPTNHWKMSNQFGGWVHILTGAQLDLVGPWFYAYCPKVFSGNWGVLCWWDGGHWDGGQWEKKWRRRNSPIPFFWSTSGASACIKGNSVFFNDALVSYHYPTYICFFRQSRCFPGLLTFGLERTASPVDCSQLFCVLGQ